MMMKYSLITKKPEKAPKKGTAGGKKKPSKKSKEASE